MLILPRVYGACPTPLVIDQLLLNKMLW